MKKKIWQISRKDGHRRCGSCLRILKRDEPDFQDKELFGYRFPRVGLCCRIIKLSI